MFLSLFMTSNKLPASAFEQRLNRYEEKLTLIKKQIRTTSILRLVVFFSTVVGIYSLSSVSYIPVTLLGIAGLAAFVYLIRKHQAQELKKARYQAFVEINHQELEFLKKNTGSADPGINFVPLDHPYADDLDLFGKRSLFQLINRSALVSGKNKVAERLLTPILDEKLLLQRQEAIAELSTKLSWRQEFQAVGLLSKYLSGEKPEDQNDLPGLLNWVTETTKIYDTWFFRFLLVLNPLIGFFVVFAIVLHWIPPVYFLLFLMLPLSILGPKLSELGRIHERLTKKNNLLSKYARLFRMVENEKFTSDLNQETRDIIVEKEAEAGKEIEHLSAIAAAFDYRLNILMGILLNVFLLWDILQTIRLERWKSKNQQLIHQWFNALSTFDELSSFAGFAFGNIESTFPSIISGDFKVEGHNIKHPLISSENCVGNPVKFTGWQQFQVITGANMAGKSTYLRTVGINLVLAMTGAPVLAKSFEFKPVQLFTGIKTSDSLQDGESYFYAELKRLKELIDRLKRDQSLFIILDEILRGTNSADKQKGSKALITQLISFHCSGMIATHDLTLGELALRFPEYVSNKRFEVEIQNDNLKFDYLLKDGISENLNASFLMKKMGITV